MNTSPQERGLSISFFKYLISFFKIQKVILPAFLPVLNKHCRGNELQPALRLSFFVVYEQVCETACDIVNFSLFIRIIGTAVHVECSEKVTVTCVVLYLLYRERCIIGEEADTGVLEFVKSYVRKFVFVEEFYEVMCYTVRRY